MTPFKKLLAAVGAAALLASTAAEARLVMAFFDGNNNRLGGFTTTTNNTSLTMSGTLNGWVVTFTAGNVLSINPLDMNISGTIHRDGGAFSDASSLFGIQNGPDGAGLASVSGAFNVGTENNTLKLRLTLIDYPLPLGNTNFLEDSLSFSSFTTTGTAVAQVDPGIAQGGIQNLGTINFNGSGGQALPGNPVAFNVTGGEVDGLINLAFGFDLTTTTTTSANQFTFANSVRTRIPEPGSLALLGLSLVGLAAIRRRKAVA